MRAGITTTVVLLSACGQGARQIDARTDDATGVIDACTTCDAVPMPPPATVVWEVNLDVSAGGDVYPVAVVPVASGVIVLAREANYLVGSDLSVRKVDGPTWYAPLSAAQVGEDVAVVFAGERGDYIGLLRGADVEFEWATLLAPNASPLVLFDAAPAPRVLWTSPAGLRLSQFDAAGVDTWARSVTLPENVSTRGYGVAAESTSFATALVEPDQPCSILTIDNGTGNASVGLPLTPDTRRSECYMGGREGSRYVEWAIAADGSRVFAHLDDAGAPTGEVDHNPVVDAGLTFIAGTDLVAANSALLAFFASNDLTAPVIDRSIRVEPGERVYESAVGTDGLDAYVAFRVSTGSGDSALRLQKLAHVH